MRVFVLGDFKAKVIDGIKLSSDLSHLIAKADISVCNFEAPIESSESILFPKSGPRISQSLLAPQFLEDVGFNVVLLANNHMMDYGEESCLKTIGAFTRANTIGAGRGKDAYKVLVKQFQDVKIGLLSLAQYEFGMVQSESSDKVGVAWVNSPCVRDIIGRAKQVVDYLLVFPHAGAEYIDAPLPEWRDLYKRFIDWGADCIIATHPHVPQGWEEYKERPIFYSLGNFYFEGKWSNQLCTKGIAVELDVSKEGINYRTIPICVNDSFISIDESEDYCKHLQHLCELLHDENQYINYIDAKCKDLYNDMRYGLLRGLYGVSPKLKMKQIIRLLGCMILNKKNELFMLNALRCESHRWVIERYLQNNNK